MRPASNHDKLRVPEEDSTNASTDLFVADRRCADVDVPCLCGNNRQAVPEGYLGHTAPGEGLAPKTRVTEFAKTGRQFEVVFGKGDEVMSGLTDFAIKYHLYRNQPFYGGRRIR